MSRKNRPISFINEHTAEYVLVPAMAKILDGVFERIIPFYFWSTREGSSVSLINIQIRLIAVFPRRPKVIYPGQDWVLVKFNDILFQTALVSKDKGIPVFSGVPLVSSMENMSLDAQCAWFFLPPQTKRISDAHCKIKLGNLETRFDGCSNNVEGPLSDEQIIRYIFENSKPMTWEKGVENIREVRSKTGETRGFFGFLGNYKPFYMAFTENHAKGT